ncbi:MAG TPA: undecaprenyl-diphosphate phosphatase [Acidimicrobiales bacterium]
MSYLQAIVIGLLQGATELFPVSSLGHSVLVPAVFGWHNLVNDQSASESFYLAFIVGLHVATATALLVFFRRDWARIISGFFRSLRTRSIQTPDERMAWLLVVATIPVGLTGFLFEHTFRTLFAKPQLAGIFLAVNGLILAGAEVLRRRTTGTTAPDRPTGAATGAAPTATATRRLATLRIRDGVTIGVAQILALLAGISRSGVTMAAGLLRGLDHEEAARFSFLLATPVILAAGVLKVPDLAGPLGNGVRGQILAGSLAAGLAAYLSVRFLVRWFRTRTLWPFSIYCLVVGTSCAVYFA